MCQFEFGVRVYHPRMRRHHHMKRMGPVVGGRTLMTTPPAGTGPRFLTALAGQTYPGWYSDITYGATNSEGSSRHGRRGGARVLAVPNSPVKARRQG